MWVTSTFNSIVDHRDPCSRGLSIHIVFQFYSRSSHLWEDSISQDGYFSFNSIVDHLEFAYGEYQLTCPDFQFYSRSSQ